MYRIKKSFTLVEILGAVSIFMVGILSLSGLIAYQIYGAKTSANRLVAAYLAQEGIEVIRNIRDTNWLKNQNWDANIGATTDYRLDYKSRKFPDTNYSSCNPLRFDGQFYNCSQGSKTIFSRKVSVSKGADQMEIISTVYWKEKGIQHSFSVKEILFNWRP